MHGGMPVWLTYTLLGGCALLFIASFWLDRESVAARYPRLTRWAKPLPFVAIALAYLVVRPGEGDDGVQDLALASAAGKPTFVDLYSNF